MSDQQGTGTAPGAPLDGAQSADTWEELGRQLQELGSAVAEAVRAAADDPENRRRAQELKEGFESAARNVGEAFSDAFAGDTGERVKAAAGAVAAAGRSVADDVRPHLIDVTRKASEALRQTAARIEGEHGESAGTQAPTAEGGDDE